MRDGTDSRNRDPFAFDIRGALDVRPDNEPLKSFVNDTRNHDGIAAAQTGVNDGVTGRADVLNIAGQKRADARCSSAADHNHLGLNAVFSEDAFLFGHPQSAMKRADRAKADADFVLRGSLKTA